jgi:cation:H+ antiporter
MRPVPGARVLLIWIQFAVCVILIGFAGVQLTRYGDAIADKTGLGGSWIGVLLIASVTSLPELATGVSSVTAAGAPDIAVGDILGSCVFNLAILALLDLLNRPASLYRTASQGHILASGFGIVLLSSIGLGLAAGEGRVPAFGHVGLTSFILLPLYVIAMRTVFRYEKRQVAEFADREPDRYPSISLRQAALRYSVAALVVVCAGIWLPFVGRALAVSMGWTEGFVGTLFVAFVTSLPEMVVTISAVRLAALDMAVGNVLGSNLFNTAIIAVDDLFYTEGPLLAHVAADHALSVLVAVMMTGVAVIGLLYRPHRMGHVIGWTSLTLVALFLLNSYIHYH